MKLAALLKREQKGLESSLPPARRTENQNSHLQCCRKNQDATKATTDQTARDCGNMMDCSREGHQAQILHEKRVNVTYKGQSSRHQQGVEFGELNCCFVSTLDTYSQTKGTTDSSTGPAAKILPCNSSTESMLSLRQSSTLFTYFSPEIALFSPI